MCKKEKLEKEKKKYKHMNKQRHVEGDTIFFIISVGNRTYGLLGF